MCRCPDSFFVVPAVPAPAEDWKHWDLYISCLVLEITRFVFGKTLCPERVNCLLFFWFCEWPLGFKYWRLEKEAKTRALAPSNNCNRVSWEGTRGSGTFYIYPASKVDLRFSLSENWFSDPEGLVSTSRDFSKTLFDYGKIHLVTHCYGLSACWIQIQLLKSYPQCDGIWVWDFSR